jgi:hypothetical protein
MTNSARLTSDGILFTRGLDEYTQNTISQTQNVLFAAEFDEVTINPISNGLAKKEYADGRYKIAGYFDEVTSF